MSNAWKYRNFETHLKDLRSDIYPQPQDPAHTAWAISSLKLIDGIGKKLRNVLDIGCGQGFMAPHFTARGFVWTGVTLGDDYDVCISNRMNVVYANMTFLHEKDKSYDLIFARHVLEHSPFPLPSLMEWARVCEDDGRMLLVSPSPDYWTSKGRNHYSVLSLEHLTWLLNRAGWAIEKKEILTTFDQGFLDYAEGDWGKWAERHTEFPEKNLDVEYRLLCKRVDPVIE